MSVSFHAGAFEQDELLSVDLAKLKNKVFPRLVEKRVSGVSLNLSLDLPELVCCLLYSCIKVRCDQSLVGVQESHKFT